MHYYKDWQTRADFDLFEFIGEEDEQPYSGGASQNGDYYVQNQFDSTEKDQKDDQMYSVMQYNDMAFDNNPQNMYGNVNEISGNNFLQGWFYF